MTAAAAMAFLPWVCVGQGVDYEHNWAHREGGAGEDFGRGVALWHDGTVCQLSEMATGPSGGGEMKLTLTWPGATGLEVWSRVDGGTGAGGEIFPRDIAAGNNFVDMGGHPPYPLAWMHSVGSFVGQVTMGHNQLTSGAGGATVGAFVTRDYFDVPFPFQITNKWATAFTSTDIIEALTVASSPRGVTGGDGLMGGLMALGPGGPGGDIYRPLEYLNEGGAVPGLPTTVGVGGYYKGTATFPTSDSPTAAVTRPSPGGYENGYVALLVHSAASGIQEGRVLRIGTEGPQDSAAILQLGSPNGNTRVTGIAIDPKDYTVAVTGWFEAADTDFNPWETPFPPASQAGGRDIFVALYEPNWFGRLFLKWVYVTGTEYDDQGASVAFDSSGAVYATGWKGDAWGTGDLWLARFNKQIGGTFPRSISPAWHYTWPTGTGDDRGLDVAVDHLDRALVTGRFGIAGVPNYCLDFDPRSGVDTHCTVDGADIFVMRFRPNGIYDWGYSLGNDKDDVGSAIATEPMGTGRIAIGGTFGIGGSSGYSVDFDPEGGGATLQSGGGGDSFASALDLPSPEDVRNQVCFVFDNSGSMDIPEEKYVALMTALRSKLTASGNVPTNGSVMLGFVVYAQDAGVPFMPWTVIDSPQTLSAFANRLARQALPGGGENRVIEGIEGAGAQFAWLSAPGAYRHLVLIAEEPDMGRSGGVTPRTAIDILVNQQLIDQSSGIATFPDSSAGSSSGGIPRTARTYILDEIAESVVPVPVADPWEDNLGMGASVPAMLDPDFPELLERFIKRVTVCSGDYNRDGAVTQTDFDDFQLGIIATDPYADWNFNGIWEGTIGSLDFEKFVTGWDQVPCGAP